MLKNSSQLPGSKQGQSCKVVFENSNFVRQRDSRESAANLPRLLGRDVGRLLWPCPDVPWVKANVH